MKASQQGRLDNITWITLLILFNYFLCVVFIQIFTQRNLNQIVMNLRRQNNPLVKKVMKILNKLLKM